MSCVVGTIVCPVSSTTDHVIQEQLALLYLVTFVPVNFAITATPLG